MGIQLNSSQTKTSSEEAFQRKNGGERRLLLCPHLCPCGSCNIPACSNGGGKGCCCSGAARTARGDPDSLCKSAKKCFIPCDADCGDIQNTSNASRCESRLACNWL